MISRRDVAGLAIGAVVGWPVVARSQVRDGMRRLGMLMGQLASDLPGQARIAAFVQGLGALGWKEGGNLRIDWRWAGGDSALFERYEAELVALSPDILVAHGSPSVAALRRETGAIPIVFTGVADPVGQGFVASLAHPSGTITGFSAYDPPMAGKWLGMLTQITPPVARVVVVYNPATAPFREVGEIEAMMAGLAREDGGGVLVLPDSFTGAHRDAIIALAARYRLPSVYAYSYFAASGGLMSYGIDPNDLFRRAAAYVDRILKGAKPSDLPVQNPTKFELVINLKAAEALAIVEKLAAIRQGDHVFPGGKAGRPISNMAMLMLLRRMGRGDLTAHGFRSSFRDWAAEHTTFPGEVAEMALAHAVGDKVEAAYRRGDLFQTRRQLMGAWARHCANVTAGAAVVPIGATR